MSYQPIVELTRGEVIESVHFGALAIADCQGDLLASWGDPEVVTFLRSSAKPFQALPLIESGAADQYGLSLKQIAVICASHSGTDAHVETVASIQDVIGASEEELLCGAHTPIDSETSQRLEKVGLEPTQNRHNCSGKHTGMLALARFMGVPTEEYVRPQHPVQQRILTAFAEMCDLDPKMIPLGVDGCSAPVFAVPLRASAMAFARLADPRTLSESRQAACQRIWSAMTSYPEMVAGEGRFDTCLMRIGHGGILSKGGAEAYLGVGIAPGVLNPDSPGMGVAIKISDGDQVGRACSVVALKVLEHLGALDREQLKQLTSFGQRALTNWRGIHVGEIRPCFKL